MSRSLQINTTVEYPSRYDELNITAAQNELDRLEKIAAEQGSMSIELQRLIHAATETLAAEKEDKITWLIGILPSSIYKAATKMKVMPISTDSKKVEISTQPDEVITNLVLVGLKGFKNFKNPDGTMVEFKTVKGTIGGVQVDMLDPDLLNIISWEHQIDIGNQVRVVNSVGAANLKN